jgi:hypothetical protein
MTIFARSPNSVNLRWREIVSLREHPGGAQSGCVRTFPDHSVETVTFEFRLEHFEGGRMPAREGRQPGRQKTGMP